MPRKSLFNSATSFVMARLQSIFAATGLCLSIVSAFFFVLVDMFKSHAPLFPALPLFVFGCITATIATPLAHLAGCYRYPNGSGKYCLWQPFSGGVLHVLEQCVGWFLYACFLACCGTFHHTGLDHIPLHGPVFMLGILSLASQVLIMASVYHFEPFQPRADVARTGKARPPRTVAKRDNAVVLLCAGVGLGMFLLADHGRTVQSHTVGLAQSAVLLHCVGVFIAYYNGYRRFPTLYKVWQPFKGGVVFETLQAVAWVLFTLALYTVIGRMHMFASVPGAFTALGTLLVASQLLLLLALEYFRVPSQALAWNSEKAGCFLLGLFGTVMLIGVEVSTAWLPAYATLPCLPGLPSAVVLYLAPVLTHASGRRTPQYRFIQPFVGGRRYVALQGLGWTLYSVSLSLTLLLLLNHVPRGLSVAALLGLAAEVLILASLPLFEPLPGAPPPARPGRTTISSGILVGLSTAVFVGVDLLGAALEGALGVPSHHILAVGAVLGALAPLLAQSGVAGPMLSLTQLQEGGPEYEAFQVVGWMLYLCSTTLQAVLVCNRALLSSALWTGALTLCGCLGQLPWGMICLSISVQTPAPPAPSPARPPAQRSPSETAEAYRELREVLKGVESHALRGQLAYLLQQLAAEMQDNAQHEAQAPEPAPPPATTQTVPFSVSMLSLALCFIAEVYLHSGAPKPSLAFVCLVALAFLGMCGAPVLTHCVVGPARHATWRLWQPFRGGLAFVLLQAAGWTLIGLAFVLTIVLMCARQSDLPVGAVTFAGLAGSGGHTLLFLSLAKYRDDAQMLDHRLGPDAFLRRHANDVSSMLLGGVGLCLYTAGDLVYRQPDATVPVTPIIVLASVATGFAMYLWALQLYWDADRVSAADAPATGEPPMRWWHGLVFAGPALTSCCSVVLVYWAAQSILPLQWIHTYAALLALLPASHRMCAIVRASPTSRDALRSIARDAACAAVTFALFLIPVFTTASVIGVSSAWGTLGSAYVGCALTVHTFTWVHLSATRALGWGLVLYALLTGNLDCVAWALAGLWYLSYYNDAHITGARRREAWVAHAATWDLVAGYFGYRLIGHGALAPGQTYLACFHPHGVYAATCFWGVRNSAFRRRYPGVVLYPHVATIIFRTPFLRDIMQWCGVKDVSRASLDHSLRTGHSPILVPGGQAEMLMSRARAPAERLCVKHEGFIRLALKHGAPLVPVYCFGETRIFDNVRLHPIQDWFRNRARFAYPFLPYGRWWLPLPRAEGLTVVVGDPIPVAGPSPSPTDDEVRALRCRYYAALKALFDRYKGECGYEGVELVFSPPIVEQAAS